MSSIRFSAELVPDAALRRLVLLCGAVLSAVGVALIAGLQLPAAVLFAGGIAWLAMGARELGQIRRGFACCLRLRLSPDGTILMLDIDGDWQVGRLLPGSIVLRRIAWIRVAIGQDLTITEPFVGSCRESDDWRRLQVIWRHIGATR